MKPILPLGWPELRQLLDYSYRAGNGAETIRMFQQQRAEATQSFPPCKYLPFPAHSRPVAWAEALFYNCPELKPCHVDISSGFSTRRFLISFLSVYAVGRIPDARQYEVLLLLQKRFEVNRRIFAEYDQDVRRVGDDFTCLDQYSLLAFALQIRYLDSSCFSFLNTAVKVLDLVVFSGWSESNPRMISLPLALEKGILDELQVA